MSAAAAPPPGTHRRTDDGAPWRAPSFAWALLVSAACVPALLSIATVLGQEWHASLDQALELLRIRDVGSVHTPLVGVFSRWGWAHPGPAIFYALAPFERIGGQVGILVGAGVINLAALTGAVVVGLHRGGIRLGLTLAALFALLSAGLGPDLLIDPWNPSVAVLPFAAFLVLVWQATTGAPWLLVGAAAVGSFVVQAHVGYLPLVAAPVLVAGLVAMRQTRHRRRGDRRAIAVVAATAVVLLAMWAPPLWAELTGAGNLGALWSYGRTPVAAAAGWGEAAGVMGTHLQPLGPWITGRDINDVGLARTDGGVLGFLALAVAIVVAGAAHRRDRAAGTLPLVALLLVAVTLNLIATARIEGFFAPYLTLPWRVLGFATALVIVWSITVLAGRRAGSPAGVVVGAAALIAAAVLTCTELPATPPLPTVSTAVGSLGRQLVAELDPVERHLLSSVDARTFDAVKPGLVLYLEERGIEVRVDPAPIASLQYGSWRLATPSEVDVHLFVADLTYLDQGWRPPPGSRRIARHDPLGPARRAEASRLEARIRADMGPAAPNGPLYLNTPYVRGLLVGGGASPADVDALAALYEPGDAYFVYRLERG